MTEVQFGIEEYDLEGSGVDLPRSYGYRSWAAERWEDLPLSDRSKIKAQVPDFDPKEKYTNKQLVALAEKILINDPKHPHEHPMVLLAGPYRWRFKHEIYTENGTPDPSIASGLYWRTHPQGRRVNDDEQRQKNATSFYR